MTSRLLSGLTSMTLGLGLVACADSGLPTATPESSSAAFAVLGQPTDRSTTGVPMVDLGVLKGEDRFALSTGYGINQQSRVVGASGRFAFLWTMEGNLEKLELKLEPPVTGNAQALDINEVGQVTGDYDFGCVDEGVFMGFIWHRGTSVPLGTLYPPAEKCEAGSTGRAVNNRGQVVGWGEAASGNLHGFLWEDGEMMDLGTLPGASWSEAWGINQRGQIVGYSDDQACLWENGLTAPQPLGGSAPPGGTIAVAINDAGTVVGWSTTAAGERAYRWRDDMWHDLGELDGYPQSQARAINRRGVIVGASVATDGSERATMWEPGSNDATDLGTLRGGDNSSAFAVNVRGVIAGWSESETTSGELELHAVLWIP